MKNLVGSVIVLLASTFPPVMQAQETKLPTPSVTGGMPANEVFARRHSTREFDPARPVAADTLGQLLWMTLGINRPGAEPGRFGKAADRTNPTALNWQEINAYVFTKDGVDIYQPSAHSLRRVVDGDHRGLLTGTAGFTQDFVLEAPVAVLFVADMSQLPEDERTTAMALVDAGIACENLNIACAALGLATVPRATMDTAGIAALLGLSSRQLPVVNNPIGYAR